MMNAASSGPAGTRRIRSKEDGTSLFASWAFVIVYCAISFPLFYIMAIKDRSLFASLITGFFAVFGIVYIVWTVHFTLNRLKFGQIDLNMPVAKPPLGGEVTGSIVLPARAAQSSKVRVELRCLRVVIGTDSKGRSTRSEKREWYEERFFAVRRSGGRAQAEFRMKVPDEPVISRDEPYVWEIQVVADLPGVDLSRSFIIEVDQQQSAVQDQRQSVFPDQRQSALPAQQQSLVPAVTVRAPSPSEGGFAPAQAFAIPRAATASAASDAARDAARDVQPEPESAMPVAALLTANMVPLAGVLFLGWKVGDIVLLYWLENLVIGLMNLARIASAQPDALLRHAQRGKRVRPHELLAGKLFLGGFFLVHYGAFCAAHATFLAYMFPVRGPGGGQLEMGGVIGYMLGDPGIVVAVLGLLISHLISFFRNYLGRGEYRQADIGRLMTQPYGRIVVVHIFIIFGGLLISDFGSPMAAMVLFVIIKTAVDLQMHRRERRLMQQGNDDGGGGDA